MIQNVDHNDGLGLQDTSGGGTGHIGGIDATVPDADDENEPSPDQSWYAAELQRLCDLVVRCTFCGKTSDQDVPALVKTIIHELIGRVEITLITSTS